MENFIMSKSKSVLYDSTRYVSQAYPPSCPQFQFQNSYQPVNLCQKIFHLIQDIFSSKKNQQSYQIVQSIILTNRKVQESIKFMRQKLKSKKILTPSKDRKTSFFRTIIKFLKIKQPKIASSELQKKKLHFLYLVQKKLNRNTISSQDIDILSQLWNTDIVNYLNSQRCIDDFVNKNKSTVNKDFYLFHLREIAIQTQNGNLSKYPFFFKEDIIFSIKRMIRTFYCHKLKKLNIIQDSNIGMQEKQKNSDTNEDSQTSHIIDQNINDGYVINNFKVQFFIFSEPVKQLAKCE